jgi:hypothetical protein
VVVVDVLVVVGGSVVVVVVGGSVVVEVVLLVDVDVLVVVVVAQDITIERANTFPVLALSLTAIQYVPSLLVLYALEVATSLNVPANAAAELPYTIVEA